MKNALFIFFMFLVLNSLNSQDTLSLKEHLTNLFNSGNMTQYEKECDKAIAYFSKNNIKDSLALLFADKSRSTELNQGIGQAKILIDKSLKLLESLNNVNPKIKLSIYQDASHIFQVMHKTDSTKYFFKKIDQLLKKYPEDFSPKAKGVSYYNIAAFYYYNSDFEEAIKNINKAISIFEKAYGQKNNFYISSISLLATVYYYQSKIQQSLDLQRESVLLRDSLSNTPTYNSMVGHYNFVGILDEVGDYRNAIKQNDIALNSAIYLIDSNIINERFLISMYDSYANIYTNLNMPYKAIAMEEKAKNLLEKYPDEYQPYFYSNLATGYLDIGEIKKAEESIKKAYSNYYKFDPDNKLIYARILNTDAQVNADKKNYKEALSKYRKSIEIQNKETDSPYWLTAEAFSQIGNIHYLNKNYNKALKSYNKAIEISDSIYPVNHPHSFMLRTDLATCYAKMGKTSKAKTIYNKLFASSGIDTVSFDVKDWSKLSMNWTVPYAIREYIFLVEDTNGNDNPDTHKKLESLYLLYLKKHFQYTDAFSVNREVDSDTYSTFSKMINYYVDISKKGENQNERIFNLIQESKSFISKLIINDISIENYSGVPDSIILKEQKLKNSLQIIANQMLEGESQNLDKSYFENEKKLIKLTNFIKNNYPKYYNYKYNIKFPTIKKIQENLDKATVILDYFISDTICLGMFISKDKFELKNLHTSPEIIQKAVEKFNHNLQNTLSDDWKADKQKLYNYLLKPFENFSLYSGNATNQKHIRYIINPDASLWDLNFELLFPGNKPQAHDIVYMTGIDYLKTNYPGNKKTGKIIGFIPEFKDSKDFLSQPNSKKLGDILKNEFGAKVFYGKFATESQLKKNARDYSLLHISTHGIIDEDDPMATRLILSPDTTNDGKLKLNEVFGLTLNNTLTVLNACSTSKGKYRHGIGKNSFAFAFRFAGSDNILTSLWPIDEATSTDIIKTMYKKIEQGNSISKALYLAKQEFVKNAPQDLKHPYYWAGLNLIGNPEIYAQHDSGYIEYLKYIAIFLVLFLLFFLYNRKRKNQLKL